MTFKKDYFGLIFVWLIKEKFFAGNVLKIRPPGFPNIILKIKNLTVVTTLYKQLDKTIAECTAPINTKKRNLIK